MKVVRIGALFADNQLSKYYASSRKQARDVVSNGKFTAILVE